jgi:hypothetical protein
VLGVEGVGLVWPCLATSIDGFRVLNHILACSSWDSESDPPDSVPGIGSGLGRLGTGSMGMGLVYTK